MASEQTVLEIEIERLKNATQHLERSNRELKEAMAEQEVKDPDFKEALQENIVVIAKYRARIVSLEEELKRMKGQDSHTDQPNIASVPVEDTMADAADTSNMDDQQAHALGHAATEPGQAQSMDVDQATQGNTGEGVWL